MCVMALTLVGCAGESIPRPYGYMRMEVPDTAYTRSAIKQAPVIFALSDHAEVVYKKIEGTSTWFDISYPTLNANVHCSYQKIEGNLIKLTDDAQKFVYRHASQADAIPERSYEHAENRVYGVMYELYGNTASPLQFVLTDSTKHFFRASVYFNCTPNQDSIAPALDYIKGDVVRMIESFEWQ